jgi:hypothetical protein
MKYKMLNPVSGINHFLYINLLDFIYFLEF